MGDYVSPAKQGIMFDPLLTALKPFQGKPVLLRHLLPVSYTCAVRYVYVLVSNANKQRNVTS